MHLMPIEGRQLVLLHNFFWSETISEICFHAELVVCKPQEKALKAQSKSKKYVEHVENLFIEI